MQESVLTVTARTQHRSITLAPWIPLFSWKKNLSYVLVPQFHYNSHSSLQKDSTGLDDQNNIPFDNDNDDSDGLPTMDYDYPEADGDYPEADGDWDRDYDNRDFELQANEDGTACQKDGGSRRRLCRRRRGGKGVVGGMGAGGGGGGGQGPDDNFVALWDPNCKRGSRFLNMDARNATPETAECDGDEEFNSIFNANPDQVQEGEGDSGAIFENQILGSAACKLLRKIEGACEAVLLDNNNSCEAFKIIKSLVHGSALANITAAFDDDSLLSLIQRCDEADNKVSQAVFVQMMTYIHLRVKFERLLVSLWCMLDS